jgi:hypothetical protein
VVEGITWNDITHKTSMASRRYPVWFLLWWLLFCFLRGRDSISFVLRPDYFVF